MTRWILLSGLLASTASCDGSPASSGMLLGTGLTDAGGQAGQNGGNVPSAGEAATAPFSNGGASVGGSSATSGAAGTGGGTVVTSASGSGGAVGGGLGGAAGVAGGTAGAAGGSGGSDVGMGGTHAAGGGALAGMGGQVGETGGEGGGSSSNCLGDVWPTADPTSAGPFTVTADKNVGPLAGVVPDPIYGDEQQRFSVYRPSNLAESGYCHPILIWANGYRDNPEQNPPECVVDSASNQWCGQYSPMLNHLASHGFVVVAPLSTATAEGDPLPTTAGLDWILEQAEDSSSPYYQRLDTENIGQLGHSYGGMSTCMSASDPRYRALATICGTRELSGVHTPMMFFCGGQDGTVDCDGVKDTYLTVTDHPAFFINELGADHGSWVYEGPGGVSLSSAAAWFRVHLMGDTANREYFYGPSCTFCTDGRVEVEQNALMAQ